MYCKYESIYMNLINKNHLDDVMNDIDTLTDLIFKNISPFADTSALSDIIHEWTPFIEHCNYITNVPMARMTARLQATQQMTDIINTNNSRGQTPLYVACLNNNMKIYNLLKRLGANPLTLNTDNSTILHGIAWGNDDRSEGGPTYEEKIESLKVLIIGSCGSLVLSKNDHNETYYDNLIIRHKDKMPESIKIIYQ
jgi:ankyrin repeat protein